MNKSIVISDAVRSALEESRPVVALESTIISHGFPRPQNLEAAVGFEKILTDMGVTPATIAVIDGVPHVGLEEEQLHRIAEDTSVIKVSVRDLGIAQAKCVTGATTVAATAHLANQSGIKVFSTGGLGGVHRGASSSFDESADLLALSRTPIVVVSAGVKSILDVGATLERLESLNTAVVGYRTTRYPGFYISATEFEIDWSVDSPEEVVSILVHQHALNIESAVLVANPLPVDKQLDPVLHDQVLQAALTKAGELHIGGKEVTPFILDYFQRETGGKSLAVNIDIANNNISLGGEIATAWANRPGTR